MKATVAIVRTEESGIEAAVRKAVDLAGGLKEKVTSESRVLVKPNLFRPEPSGTGIITDCRVTEAIVKVVLELKPKSVIIGEGSAAGYDFGGSYSTEEAFRVSGTAEAARRLGVELRNLNRDAFEEVRINKHYVMNKVRVAKIALESDVIISVPVLKTHSKTLVTLGLKNMKGILTGAEKRKTHRLGLDKAIADLNSVIKPSYVLIDALRGMQGLWEYPRDSVELGLIIAGADPVAVDTVGTYLMGFDPKQVMHLQYFAAREGTRVELSQVEIVGESLEANRQSFRSGFAVFKERYPQVHFVEGESACTGCTGELLGALAAIKGYKGADALKGLTVVFGNANADEVEATDKTVVLGKCAKSVVGLGKFVRGCPPMCDDIIQVICYTSGLDSDFVISSRNRDRQRNWEETKALLEK